MGNMAAFVRAQRPWTAPCHVDHFSTPGGRAFGANSPSIKAVPESGVIGTAPICDGRHPSVTPLGFDFIRLSLIEGEKLFRF